jgi:hypothetical protein
MLLLASNGNGGFSEVPVKPYVIAVLTAAYSDDVRVSLDEVIPNEVVVASVAATVVPRPVVVAATAPGTDGSMATSAEGLLAA